MRIRCPHCHNAIQIIDDQTVNSLTCQNCGSAFTLVDDQDATRIHHQIGSMVANFQLVDLLGQGSYGIVWKARDTQLDRYVAIKIPRHESLDNERAKAFVREARTASQLNHPNIVSVYEVGKHKQSVYIVAQYVDGPTLKAWKETNEIPPREAAQLCVKIASALEHAHEKGVIHRDLKPGNILIDSQGEPKITDFGLARRESGEITVTLAGAVLGTLTYMSPEQAAGESHAADRRSDIYSLGVLLFELLTSTVPFRGEKQMLIHQIMHDDPPSPRKLNASIPIDLETICLKCLQKSPGHRYQSAQEVADELSRFLRGEPVQARPISKFARAARWARRKPAQASAILALAALLATLAVGGPLIAWQQSVLARQSKDYAQSQTNLLEAQEKAFQSDIESRIDLLLNGNSDAAKAILESLQTDAAAVAPNLQRRFASSELTHDKVRLASALMLLGFTTDDVRTQLIQQIPVADTALSSDVIDALVSEADHAPAIAYIREQMSQATPQVSQQTRNRFLSTLLFLGDTQAFADAFDTIGPDSSERTRFIHSFEEWTGDISVLAQSLGQLDSPSVRSGVCLALGKLDKNTLTAEHKETILAYVRDWAQNAKDGPTHSSSNWLLRSWNEPFTLQVTSSTAEHEGYDWFVNSAGLTMLRVKAGRVTLGEGAENSDQRIEVREAEVARDFWMCDTEVSRGLFETFLNDSAWLEKQPKTTEVKINSINSPLEQCPVQSVNFEHAILFCNWLSELDGLTPVYNRTDVIIKVGEVVGPEYMAMTGKFDLPEITVWESMDNANGYRLPTFAEWELAERGNTNTAFFFGNSDTVSLLKNYAWTNENSWEGGSRHTHPSGQLMPNPFGFFDVLGNVQEMCWDMPDENGKAAPEYIRAIRGGAFDLGATRCFSGDHLSFVTSVPLRNLGFRVAKND